MSWNEPCPHCGNIFYFGVCSCRLDKQMNESFGKAMKSMNDQMSKDLLDHFGAISVDEAKSRLNEAMRGADKEYFNGLIESMNNAIEHGGEFDVNDDKSREAYFESILQRRTEPKHNARQP